MCETCETYSPIAVYGANHYDPTRTTTLRNRFAAAMNKKFNELLSVIKTGIVDNDCFGFNNLLTQQMTPPGYQQFNFLTSAEQVEAFMAWLQQQIDKGIIQVGEFPQLGRGAQNAWTNLYILDSYKRGIIRGRYELRKKNGNIPTIEETGGVDAWMNQPMHLDRVGLLFIRVFTDLQGITTEMSSQISKVLSMGMLNGDGPALMARKLIATINGTGMGNLALTDTLGRFIPAQRRAELLARTEIIRAHHVATIQEYRNWGVAGVTVEAEFRTAGDDRVCAQCASLHGNYYTLDQVEPMIPVHPLCRCFTIPHIIKNDNLI